MHGPARTTNSVFKKPGCVLANAALPRFEARGRLQSNSLPSGEGGGAPSSALSSSPRLAARASGTPDARHPALHRGDFGPRDRASGTRTAGSSPALSRGFRPAGPVPSSPCGQPPIVGADGDPTPPECVAANHARGHRASRSRFPAICRRTWARISTPASGLLRHQDAS